MCVFRYVSVLFDVVCFFFFFFKQKTAYEIKECDWSSDVCSSDLFTMCVDGILRSLIYNFPRRIESRDLVFTRTRISSGRSAACANLCVAKVE